MKDITIRTIATDQKIETAKGRFSIRPVSDLPKGKDLVHDLHRHDFYFILVIGSGNGIHEIDFHEHRVMDDSVFILRPGQVHRLELKRESSGWLIEFDTAFYKPDDINSIERLKKATRVSFCKIDKIKTDSLYQTVKHIFKEFQNRESGYLDAIKANLDLFFIEYIRQSQNQESDVRQVNGYSQERFDEFAELLNTRITEIKTVAKYAELMNLSPFQLNTITKSMVGKPASDLINAQVLLEAKRYLLATADQVKDIAYHLGYEDPSYFIRFFKKHTGLSPEAFRQNFK